MLSSDASGGGVDSVLEVSTFPFSARTLVPVVVGWIFV